MGSPLNASLIPQALIKPRLSNSPGFDRLGWTV
jgi:hypothetical protein